MRVYGLGLGSGRRVVMWAEALPVTPAVEVHKGFLFRDIDLEDARRVPSADLARTRTHRQTSTRHVTLGRGCISATTALSNPRRGPREHTAQGTRDQRARGGASYMSSRTSYAVHLSPAECTCCERELACRRPRPVHTDDSHATARIRRQHPTPHAARAQ